METLTAIFLSATMQFNLPPALLDSLCFVESKHEVTAIHHDDGGSDSLGVCQVKLETARWLGFQGTEQQLMNPKVNAYYAAKYLSRNLKRYNGQVEKSVIAYNRGSAKNLRHTQYSQKVLTIWRQANNENFDH